MSIDRLFGSLAEEQSLWNPSSKSKDSLPADLDLLIQNQQNALEIRFLALPAHSKAPVSRNKAKAKRKRKLKAVKAARKCSRRR